MAFETDEQGVVEVQGESVRYQIRIVDARSTQQREQDVRRGAPGGNIMVVIPGHGQSVHGPKKLVATAARLSRSKVVWCVDPVPARGGDRVESQAIAHVVRDRISTAFPTSGRPPAATLIGWSHGGSEALRAAVHDPRLFPQFLGMCPTGLVDRGRAELLYSFSREATRILYASARQRDWTCLRDTLRLGRNAGAGMVRDLWRARSARRVAEDINWAARSVAGTPVGYTGEVVLLFGAQDTVVRWRDLFPECERSQSISACLAEYQARVFPRASRVDVQVLDGTHVAPEADAPTFLRAGLGLLGEFDSSAPLSTG